MSPNRPVVAAVIALVAGCTDVATDTTAATDTTVEDITPAPIRVYVIAGQSNAVGGARTADLPAAEASLAQPYPAVEIAYQLECPKDGVDGPCQVNQGWTELAPRAGGLMGIELSLGRRLDERLARVAIIKTATSGANLYKQWEPDAPGGKWQWHYMIEQIDARLAELPGPATIAGLILVNGETDAQNSTIAGAHAAELGYFVHRFRAEFGADIEVVVSELGNAALDHAAAIRERQHRVSDNVAGVFVAPTCDLVYRDAIQHYDAASFAILGTRIADLFSAP